jgi:hypothetical protein
MTQTERRNREVRQESPVIKYPKAELRKKFYSSKNRALALNHSCVTTRSKHRSSYRFDMSIWQSSLEDCNIPYVKGTQSPEASQIDRSSPAQQLSVLSPIGFQERDFCSLQYMDVFWNWASSSTRGGVSPSSGSDSSSSHSSPSPVADLWKTILITRVTDVRCYQDHSSHWVRREKSTHNKSAALSK